ncbi:MAG: hypothetical protein Q7T94_04230 [Rugosibacter sp.]|nr:hypothetical protein [Rugosibacter sp.]
MDIALVGAAYNGLKFAKDALKLSLDLKVENESHAQIHVALDKLGTVQDSLFEMREELFRLQAENEELRRELKGHEDWASSKAQYELQKTPGGAVVYRFLGQPEHYACPSCFAQGTIQILQDRRVMSGTFECSGCKTQFLVKPAQRMS